MKHIKILLLLLLFCGSAKAQTPAWLTNWYSYINTTLINGPANGGTKLYIGKLYDTLGAYIYQQSLLKVSNSDTAGMLAGYTRLLDFLDSCAALRLAIEAGSGSTDTTSLSSRIDARVKYTDTSDMLAGYARLARFLDSLSAHWTAIMGKQASLGFTPVTNARTLTINGTTYDLTANRTWTISVPFFADSIKIAYDTLAAHNTRLKALEQAGYITSSALSPYLLSATAASTYAPISVVGSVTSVSVTTANGVSGSVATATTTPAITLVLGAITPSSVAASGAMSGSNLSGTNTGDQTITLTGDVTGSGTGSFAATIATVNASPATYTNATLTVNAKGQVTSASSGTAPVTSVSGTTNRITSTGGATPVIDISSTFEALLGKVASPLSQFASTTSAQLAGVLSDETGSGSAVFATSPTLVTPALGTPSALVGTNITGTASGLTAGNVTTNANLTGDITSTGNAVANVTSLSHLTTAAALVTVSTITSGTWGTGAVIAGATMTLGSDANYDIYYRNSSGVLTRLANGTTGQVLTATTSSAPSWSLGTRAINAQSGTTYTFVLGDAGYVVTGSSASATTYTVPPNSSVAYPVGTQIDIIQVGAGKITFAPGSGVTISSQGSLLSIGAQYVGVTLLKTATNTWILLGYLIA